METLRPRLLKRYLNRKLYEPAARRYVTVADVGRMLAEGHDVHVEDQKSGQDLTAQVLAQVLLEQVKDRTASIPRQVLVALIRLSAGQGAWADWPDPQAAAARVRGEAERIATGLLARGRLTLDEAQGLRQELAQSMQTAVGEAQRAIEERLHRLFARGGRDEGLAPALHALDEQLDSLGSALDGRPQRTAERRGTTRRSGAARGVKKAKPSKKA